MSAPVVTFFNNKGGVGKTSLVYHLAWMLADLGHRVVAADLDPQANLTSAFLGEDELEGVWPLNGDHHSIWGAIRPFHEGDGAIGEAPLDLADERLALLPGDLMLSSFEDDLGNAWARSADRDLRAYRTMSAFSTVLLDAAETHSADVVLVDVGPSLGAINRAALVASDHVVVPVAPDLFSLQGLRNLGPTLDDWRTGWRTRLESRPATVTVLPSGAMDVVGYVVLGHGVRLNRPVKAYQRWMRQIPNEFHSSLLSEPPGTAPTLDSDPYCLAQLKHYHSLLPLAQEARKPIFDLTAADGAFGGHAQAAQSAYQDFRQLAETIIGRVLPEQRHPDRPLS